MDYKAPRGTRDILPVEAGQWQSLEARFKKFCALYGFGEIRTPLFEHTELFARHVGEESDIVSKEMYTFNDRSGRKLTLRPEGTAAVARSYLEHNLKDVPQPVKLYYLGPMFRYDRPQAGRYRQFHQFGLELFGASHPAADAEIIDFSYKFVKSLGIENITLELNSVGCLACRPRFREKLLSFLNPLAERLCVDCRRRFTENPLRVLDCKEESCRGLVEGAPSLNDHLCDPCSAHFAELQLLLARLSIPFNLNPRLVRGLDYYTRTAFELDAHSGSAQGSLCGGGRYDHLVEHCGGPQTPGVGVAFGVERLLLAADPAELKWDETAPVFIATAGEALESESLSLAAEMRPRGIAAEVELISRSLKAQMKHAGRKGYRQVAIIGQRELEQGLITLRDMADGSQEELSRETLWEKIGRTAGAAAPSKPSIPRVTEEPLYRTAACGTLRRANAGQPVTLSGWVQRRRDHGGLIFIDLRDRTGLIQLVFDGSENEALFLQAEKLRGEYVIMVTGQVVARLPANINPALETGEVEVRVTKMELLNAALTPPFYIEDDLKADENLRLRYRYLDLRRPEMYRRLAVRHRGAKLVRDFLDAQGFLEVETPTLTRSTPEGARDYLVPSRVHPGSFYALPQSPQLFKQLLMVGGVERYYQIARCFRDEDLRADRQPEFTQIDIEASFFGMENLFTLMEGMMALLWSEIKGFPLAKPFPRMPYREAMNRYGSDKPDLRYGMELIDCTDLALVSEFKVFRGAAQSGGVVKAIRVAGGGKMSRKELDELATLAAGWGAKGLAWMILEERGWRSPIAKFMDDRLLERLGSRMEAVPGDLLLFAADAWEKACRVLGQLRLHLAPAGLPDEPRFLWVTDFPLFEYNAEEQRYDSSHHPFTEPKEEDLALLDTDPLAVRAQCYDLVLNGVELGSGSNRIFKRETQVKIFNLLGFSDEESKEKFGFLLEAFEYGAPPHGGIALGLDRIIALLVGDESIRQVIAFPKTAGAGCLLTGAPAPVATRQLDDLAITVKTLPENAG
ncbi:MAG: aspartate--tRNA ligase [Bacillota bacterium]